MPPGKVMTATAASPVLAGDIHHLVYLPPAYPRSEAARYPVLYLLHGRGDSMEAWRTIVPDLDRMIAAGEIPAVIAVLPDAPSNQRAGYYIDSRSAGGRAVETAFTLDLVAHIDATYHTQAGRAGRIVAGYSMGGYGAIRFALAHPDLFGAAIVLSPAVYHPLPPHDSSAREFGAFGSGDVNFDEAIYRAKNYPALLPVFRATKLPLVMFIAVGDDEAMNPDPADAEHDLDFEAHVLYNSVRRVSTIDAQLRVIEGGHSWKVWRPMFVEGLRYVLNRLQDSRGGIQPSK